VEQLVSVMNGQVASIRFGSDNCHRVPAIEVRIPHHVF